MWYVSVVFFLFQTLLAHQPFENVFVSDGIAPVVYENRQPDIVIIQSNDQFVRFVTKAHGPVVVRLDCCGRDTYEKDADAFHSMIREWPSLLSGVVIDTSQQPTIVSSLLRAFSLTSVDVPSYVVFVEGKAIVPMVTAATPEELYGHVAERIACGCGKPAYRVLPKKHDDGLLKKVWAWVRSFWA